MLRYIERSKTTTKINSVYFYTTPLFPLYHFHPFFLPTFLPSFIHSLIHPFIHKLFVCLFLVSLTTFLSFVSFKIYNTAQFRFIPNIPFSLLGRKQETGCLTTLSINKVTQQRLQMNKIDWYLGGMKMTRGNRSTRGRTYSSATSLQIPYRPVWNRTPFSIMGQISCRRL